MNIDTTAKLPKRTLSVDLMIDDNADLARFT